MRALTLGVVVFQLFHRLRTEKPSALNKVVPIDGDVELEDLGLIPAVKARLQDEVSVVFHCAATLRLEAKLKDATEMNTAGTWRMLQMARDMIQLKVRLHDAVSAAAVMWPCRPFLCSSRTPHFMYSIWNLNDSVGMVANLPTELSSLGFRFAPGALRPDALWGQPHFPSSGTSTQYRR